MNRSARALHGSPATAAFDMLFPSCDRKVTKPDRAAYEAVLRVTGARPEKGGLRSSPPRRSGARRYRGPSPVRGTPPAARPPRR
ncbi:hypothetical protein FE156_00785 [Streptomyces albidoflavus]|nr:hypothetical protein FE156_00785 [Streptomyces albidoflavus]